MTRSPGLGSAVLLILLAAGIIVGIGYIARADFGSSSAGVTESKHGVVTLPAGETLILREKLKKYRYCTWSITFDGKNTLNMHCDKRGLDYDKVVMLKEGETTIIDPGLGVFRQDISAKIEGGNAVIEFPTGFGSKWKFKPHQS